MTRRGADNVSGAKVLLCVSGGIAAYKVAGVARELTEMGADVRVIMTEAARAFVGPQTFAALSRNPVSTEVIDDGPDAPHVKLARDAAVAIVAPATANALAKMALGIADDLLSATLLMVRCPIVVAPAMHTEMWQHPATSSHVAALTERGVRMVGPAAGPLASGDEGPGRMAEPEDIVAEAVAVLGGVRDLDQRRVLVTAGGTQEPIDAVRFIGNRSSGRMGYAIAETAARRGAQVTLISGPTALDAPPGVELVPVETAAEMRDAVLAAAPSCDAIVKAAAVADFRPEHSASHKLKKAAGPPELFLVPTTDILAELGRRHDLRKPGSVVVGFAAETEPDPERLAQQARAKLASKGVDVIVANDVGSEDSGFGMPTNRAVIADRDGTTDVGLVTKQELAEAVCDRLSKLLG